MSIGPSADASWSEPLPSTFYWVAESQSINSVESSRTNKGKQCNNSWKMIWVFIIGQRGSSEEVPRNFIEKFNAQGARAKEELRIYKDRSNRSPDRSDWSLWNFTKSARDEKKGRPSFEELLTKYEKKRAAQKQRRRPSTVKDAKPSPGHREQPDSCWRLGYHVAAPYSFGELVAPWF